MGCFICSCIILNFPPVPEPPPEEAVRCRWGVARGIGPIVAVVMADFIFTVLRAFLQSCFPRDGASGDAGDVGGATVPSEGVATPPFFSGSVGDWNGELVNGFSVIGLVLLMSFDVRVEE